VVNAPPADAVQSATESYNGSTWTTVPGTLNTARASVAGAGIQTAALAFGGANTPGVLSSSESYNGTSWTNTNSLNTARRTLGGCGASNTSAVAFGGYTTVASGATEVWNGTSWTNSTSMTSAREDLSSSGTQASALAAGGYSNPGPPSGGIYANTEEWTGPYSTLNYKTLTTS
jgi:hypothetical protein